MAATQLDQRRHRLVQVQKIGALRRPGETLVRHELLPTREEVRVRYSKLLRRLQAQHSCVYCGAPHSALDNFTGYRCLVHGAATTRYTTEHQREVWPCCGGLPHSNGCIACIHSSSAEARFGIEAAIRYTHNDMLVSIPNELIDHDLVSVGEHMYQTRDHKTTNVYGIQRPPAPLLWDTTRRAGRGPPMMSSSRR